MHTFTKSPGSSYDALVDAGVDPTVDAALAAAATLVATAFALATAERWQARHRPHELAWTLALALFALGSAALWAGAAFGWVPLTFRVFYWAGAVANVPLLAVGTVYLLAGPRAGRRAFGAVVLAVTFSAGWVLAAPLVGPVPVEDTAAHATSPDATSPHTMPHGREVFGPVPRAMAAVGSGLGATVLLGGAVLSAVRLLRSGSAARPASPLAPRRLAAANGCIAAGTLVLSASGALVGTLGDASAFSVSLAAGISLIFTGFLLTNTPAPTPPAPVLPPWLHQVLTAPLDVEGVAPQLLQPGEEGVSGGTHPGSRGPVRSGRT